MFNIYQNIIIKNSNSSNFQKNKIIIYDWCSFEKNKFVSIQDEFLKLHKNPSMIDLETRTF